MRPLERVLREDDCRAQVINVVKSAARHRVGPQDYDRLAQLLAYSVRLLAGHAAPPRVRAARVLWLVAMTLPLSALWLAASPS